MDRKFMLIISMIILIIFVGLVIYVIWRDNPSILYEGEIKFQEMDQTYFDIYYGELVENQTVHFRIVVHQNPEVELVIMRHYPERYQMKLPTHEFCLRIRAITVYEGEWKVDKTYDKYKIQLQANKYAKVYVKIYIAES